MSTLYCDCGQAVTASYEWNGLSEVRHLWNENGEPIDDCPHCGQTIVGYPLKREWNGDLDLLKSDIEFFEQASEELSDYENSINAMDKFCKWVESKDPAFASDIRGLFTEYITRPTLRAVDAATGAQVEGASDAPPRH